MRDLIFTNLVSQLEYCDNDNGMICFKTRDINTEKNNTIILEHYDILRKIYKLSPNTRRPKKFTSQTLLQICRCLKYDIHRKAAYARSSNNTGTTYGIYSITIN